MVVSPLSYINPLYIVAFFASVILIAIAKSPWFKGIVGEAIVNASTRMLLNKEEYTMIKDVTLLLDDGSTTQIDHIIVSRYGIFVVETKNMKGWIFGNERQKKWTQKIYKQTHPFQNPLHQNYKHTKAIQELLDLEESEVFSLVVFVGESTFKTDMPPNVTQGIGYIRYIKSKETPLFSSHEVDAYVAKIHRGRMAPTRKTRKEHIANIKNPKRRTPSIVIPEAISCPKCGSEMVLRTAQKGHYKGKEFWGCSKYPYCKGVINIEK